MSFDRRLKKIKIKSTILKIPVNGLTMIINFTKNVRFGDKCFFPIISYFEIPTKTLVRRYIKVFFPENDWLNASISMLKVF